MNKTEQKALLAILLDGDLLAAIDYIEKAGKPARSAKVEAGGVKPIPREIPKWPKGFSYIQEGTKGTARERVITERPTVLDGIAKAIFMREGRPGHLAIAPCGCTLYPDTALMCAACIAARNPEACRALIQAHLPVLDAFSATLTGCYADGKPRPSAPPRTRDFMISPHNGYYGEKDGFAAESAA